MDRVSIEAFKTDPLGDLYKIWNQTVEAAEHFVQAQQPEQYTRIVLDFVNQASAG